MSRQGMAREALPDLAQQQQYLRGLSGAQPAWDRDLGLLLLGFLRRWAAQLHALGGGRRCSPGTRCTRLGCSLGAASLSQPPAPRLPPQVWPAV
jgi:hypothetical protein